MITKAKQKKKYVIKKKQTKKPDKKIIKKNNTSNIRNEIIGILMLSLGLLIFLGYYIDDSMGIFGAFIKELLTGLSGIPSVIIPILLIVFPILLIFKKDKEDVKRKSLYTFILLTLISAIFQSGTYKYSDFINRSPIGCIVKFYKDGNSFTGGGVLGGIISLPLLLLFQSLGTIVILTTASIIVAILLTDISICDVIKKIVISIITGSKAVAQGISEGRESGQSDEEGKYYTDDRNVYKSNKKKKNDNLDEENNNGGMGFTFNVSGIEAADASNLKNQNKVIDMKKRKKSKYFTLNEGKQEDNEDISTNNTPQLAEDMGKNGNDKKQADTIDTNILPFNLEEPAKVNKISSNDLERNDNNVTADKIPSGNDIKESGKIIKEMLYKYPPLSILNESSNNDKNLKTYRTAAIEGAKKLEDTLKSFSVEAKVVNVSMGPTVTRYELQPSPGVKVSRIVNLADDIALNLASSGVRIEAPIPGKAAVGIEVPNKEVTPVLLREVLESQEFNRHPSKVAFAAGKDISGECIIADIAKMPHMLIAGATGSGKSVCINSLIMSILFKSSPDEVKMLLIDPKVVELGVYNGIPHLLIPVVTDPKKAAGALNWAVQEMINRYKLFADKGVRDIRGYNEQISAGDEQDKLPSIVIIIDELSDLMMAAPGDVEDAICRLAQMARAAGMHLVVATQRPSVDVITGLIKANIPSRISFAVSSQVDSRTILDMGGAEKLLGKGDMLFYPTGKQKPLRVQGAFVSDKEVENTVEFIKAQCIHEYDNTIIDEIDNNSITKDEGFEQEYDELLSQAIEMVIEAGQASVSLVQRRFKVGYARAARMIDQMEARGIVGGFEGSKPRQVLISKQQWEEMKMSSSI